MRKKGIELNQAFGAVLTLVLVAILVIVTVYLVVTLQTSLQVSQAGTVVNESVTSSGETGLSASLERVRLTDANCGAITKVYNTTGAGIANLTIALANFTQTGCVVVNASTMEPWGTALKFSYPYTYNEDTGTENATQEIITQFGTYPALIGLVGTIIFLALVIGVLIASFAFGGRKGV